MKVTLNSSIPEKLRPQVEELVKKFAGNPSIIWLPSRFPRYVMLIEPGSESGPEPESGSIFESPRSGNRSIASVTEFLEEKIKAFLG